MNVKVVTEVTDVYIGKERMRLCLCVCVCVCVCLCVVVGGGGGVGPTLLLEVSSVSRLVLGSRPGEN